MHKRETIQRRLFADIKMNLLVQFRIQEEGMLPVRDAGSHCQKISIRKNAEVATGLMPVAFVSYLAERASRVFIMSYPTPYNDKV